MKFHTLCVSPSVSTSSVSTKLEFSTERPFQEIEEAGFVCMVCKTNPALSFRTHFKSMHSHFISFHSFCSVMLNYVGEYCDACQVAVTVIRSSDAALKSCLE